MSPQPILLPSKIRRLVPLFPQVVPVLCIGDANVGVRSDLGERQDGVHVAYIRGDDGLCGPGCGNRGYGAGVEGVVVTECLGGEAGVGHVVEGVFTGAVGQVG